MYVLGAAAFCNAGTGGECVRWLCQCWRCDCGGAGCAGEGPRSAGTGGDAVRLLDAAATGSCDIAARFDFGGDVYAWCGLLSSPMPPESILRTAGTGGDLALGCCIRPCKYRKHETHDKALHVFVCASTVSPACTQRYSHSDGIRLSFVPRTLTACHVGGGVLMSACRVGDLRLALLR